MIWLVIGCQCLQAPAIGDDFMRDYSHLRIIGRKRLVGVQQTLRDLVRSSHSCLVFNVTNIILAGRTPSRYDYAEKYREDAYGEEEFTNACVWKVFNDEMGVFDVERIETWRDALDVLLVFVCHLLTLLFCTLSVDRLAYSPLSLPHLLSRPASFFPPTTHILPLS
jgi:hypothetical protein